MGQDGHPQIRQRSRSPRGFIPPTPSQPQPLYCATPAGTLLLCEVCGGNAWLRWVTCVPSSLAEVACVNCYLTSFIGEAAGPENRQRARSNDSSRVLRFLPTTPPGGPPPRPAGPPPATPAGRLELERCAVCGFIVWLRWETCGQRTGLSCLNCCLTSQLFRRLPAQW